APDARAVQARNDHHETGGGEVLGTEPHALVGLELVHPSRVSGGEDVGAGAALELQRELLRAREVELHSQAGVATLERLADLGEGLGEAGSGGGEAGRRRLVSGAPGDE